MERKIGEIFDYHGLMLKVMKTESCEGCYFYGMGKNKCECFYRDKDITGECIIRISDDDWVRFEQVDMVG